MFFAIIMEKAVLIQPCGTVITLIADQILGMRLHVPNHVKSCLSFSINSFSSHKVVETSLMLISVFFVCAAGVQLYEDEGR